MPLKWVVDVLKEAVKMLGSPNVFVLSVLHLQSTGKCTRGAFIQLLKFDEDLKKNSNYDYILIVDTEGLHAHDGDSLTTQKYDNQLATFITGLADTTLINVFNQSHGDMFDILQISIHAFLRMNKVRCCPNYLFVHQNDGVNSEGEMRHSKFTQKFNKLNTDAARQEHCEGHFETFSDVIKFNQTDVYCLPELWKSYTQEVPISSMTPINPRYSQAAQGLKYHIIQTIKKKRSEEKSNNSSLESFHTKLSDLWEELLKENFVFCFKNTNEITVYNSLEMQFRKWDSNLRSAMLKWEEDAKDKINTEPLEFMSNKVQEKIQELQHFIPKHCDSVKFEMDVLFNGEQRETLVRWKEMYEFRLIQLVEEVKLHAEEHCRDLLKSTIVIIEFEKTRDRNDDCTSYHTIPLIFTRARERAG